MPKYIEITEDEAWAIDHTIRHTYSEGAENVGRSLLLKVMNLILEFEERRGKPFAPQVLPLAVTEDECWAIDHQIRCDLTVNGKPIGRSILLKAFGALTEYANERDSVSGVERLGALADLLRAPSEEENVSGGDAASGDSQEAGGEPGDGSLRSSGSERRHKPEDGSPEPLPRDK